MARGVLVILYFFQYVDKRPGPVALVLLRFVKKQMGRQKLGHGLQNEQGNMQI